MSVSEAGGGERLYTGTAPLTPADGEASQRGMSPAIQALMSSGAPIDKYPVDMQELLAAEDLRIIVGDAPMTRSWKIRNDSDLKPEVEDVLGFGAPKSLGNAGDLQALAEAVGFLQTEFAPESAPPAAAGTPNPASPQRSSGGVFRLIETGLNGKIFRVVALGALVGAIGTGVAAAAAAQSSERDSAACSDTLHESARTGDKGSLSEALGQIMRDRGYTMSEAEVRALNPEAAKTDGSLFCFLLPAPIVGGQYVANGKSNLEQISRTWGTAAETLAKLNSSVVPKDAAALIPDGTRIFLTDKPDTTLAMRPMPGNFNDETHGDGDKVAAYVMSNLDAFDGPDGKGTNVPFAPGGNYRLEYHKTGYMDAHSLTPEQIIAAYVHAGAYDPKTRGTGAASPSAAPEAIGVGKITAEQMAIIESMPGLTTDQKQFVKDITQIIMELQPEFEKHGINPTVTLAQMTWESTFGTSDLAKEGHNYSGMRAVPSQWTGTKMYYRDGNYRTYTDMRAGVRGHIDNLVAKNWYTDARHFPNPADYKKCLRGLLGVVDASGNVLIAQGAEGSSSYATDSNYFDAVSGRIDKAHMDKMFPMFRGQPAELKGSSGDTQSAVSAAPSGKEVGDFKHRRMAPETIVGNVSIDHKWYLDNTEMQGSLWVNNNPSSRDNFYLMIDGQKVPLYKLNAAAQIRIIEAELNAVNPTAEGFKAFVANYHDVSGEIAANSFFKNFHGEQNGYGTFNAQDPAEVRKHIKYIVWHYTATSNDSFYDRKTGAVADGILGATQMQNGGGGIGSWGFTNTDGTFYQLVDNDHIVNVYGLNEVCWGIENHAGGQAMVNSKQYTADIYATVNFLIKYGYVQKGQSVTDVVNRVVRGHGELTEATGKGDHNDMTSMVMDPARALMIKLLTGLGYAK